MQLVGDAHADGAGAMARSERPSLYLAEPEPEPKPEPKPPAHVELVELGSEAILSSWPEL